MIFIRATPSEIWRAITDPEMTRNYYYGTDIKSDWTPGARWTSESGDELYLDGEILEVDAPHRLVQTFHVAAGRLPPLKHAPIAQPEANPHIAPQHSGCGEAKLVIRD